MKVHTQDLTSTAPSERGVTVLLSAHLGLAGCPSALLIEAGNPTSRDEFTVR